MVTILSTDSMHHQTNGDKGLFSVTCSAHPNVKGSSEVVQIGLNEADVFQTELSTTTLGPDQGLFFVLYEEDLEYRQKTLTQLHVIATFSEHLERAIIKQEMQEKKNSQ